jgi:hypothetical protein
MWTHSIHGSTIISWLYMQVSAYGTYKLPPELASRHITPTFHASLIQPYVLNDSHEFPQREAKSFYDFGNDDEQEWLIDKIIAHQWASNKELEFQVQWMLGDVTWEPYTVRISKL